MEKASTSSLKELCALHPDDPILHIQYGETLRRESREILATYAFRQAYKLLKNENPVEAGKLVEQYGQEVALDELRPMISGNYLLLAEYYGMLERRRHRVRLSEGQVLFREGEPADDVYLIIQGELAVTTGLEGKPLLLNYLHPGSLVGEGALQQEAVRCATVTANTDVTLLRFSPDVLQKALSGHPDIHIQLGKEAMHRKQMTLLSSHGLFAQLPMDLRFMIAKRTWGERYSPGKSLKSSGKYMNHVALLLSGTAHLYDGGVDGMYCGQVKAGELLGLEYFVTQELSVLGIVADMPCETMCIEFQVVRDVMELFPWFHRRIMEMGEQFASQLTRTMMLQRATRKSV